MNFISKIIQLFKVVVFLIFLIFSFKSFSINSCSRCLSFELFLSYHHVVEVDVLGAADQDRILLGVWEALGLWLCCLGWLRLVSDLEAVGRGLSVGSLAAEGAAVGVVAFGHFLEELVLVGDGDGV